MCKKKSVSKIPKLCVYIKASRIRYKIGKIMFSKSTTHFEKLGIKTVKKQSDKL